MHAVPPIATNRCNLVRVARFAVHVHGEIGKFGTAEGVELGSAVD